MSVLDSVQDFASAFDGEKTADGAIFSFFGGTAKVDFDDDGMHVLITSHSSSGIHQIAFDNLRDDSTQVAAMVIQAIGSFLTTMVVAAK